MISPRKFIILQYLDLLDEFEPVDGDGLISSYNGSDFSLPSDGDLEIRGGEGESEEKQATGRP